MGWRHVSKEERKRREKYVGGRLVRKRGRDLKNVLETRYSRGQEKKMRNMLEAR